MHRLIPIFPAFVVVLIQHASAAVVHSDLQDLGIPMNLDGTYLNIVSGESSSAQPSDWNTSPTINFFFGGVGIATDEFLRPAVTARDQVASPTVGTWIDAALTYAESPYGSDDHIDTGLGGFTIEESGYLGFSFRITGDEPEPYFGWMRFTPSTTGNSMIHEWAYETVMGQGIEVGAIPEPGVPLLAFIAASLGGLRRKRQAT